MKPAAHLLKRIRQGAQNVAYGNPLYQKILASGETPTRLFFTLPDLWPGDAQAGQDLITGRHSMFESPANVSLRHSTTALRNLRAVGSDAARQMSVQLIENWLTHHDTWHQDEWSPAILGSRIAGWIGFYEFFAPVASANFIADLTSSLHRQWKHLMRTLPAALTGPSALQAIRGLTYGGLNFPEGDKALGFAIDLINRQIATEILPDGGVIARSPSIQLHMLRHLIDLRAAFKAAEIDVPASITMAIPALIPPLKFFRHSDGGLALFHGGVEETPLFIESVITQAELRSRVLRRLPETGYERITAGRSLLLIDCAAPPPSPYDLTAHAGLLSFEFAAGRERIIVNCGTPEDASPDWRQACAATAAHSTLTLEDTNACEVKPSGGLAARPQVDAQRYEQNGAQFVEMTHDGYVAKFGITHKRYIGISPDGETLSGRDCLLGPAGREFTLRWHLHPTVQALLSQSNQTALLRTSGGAGWRLRIEQGELGLESSIYCGTAPPRRSLQLKTNGRTTADETNILWSLTREKK